MKEYAEKNKETLKEYREGRKEILKEQNKEWFEKNKDKVIEYRKSDLGKKSRRIRNWKFKGVECDDFNVLYEYYINCKNCENCGVQLTEDRYNTSTTRCLDHCHETHQFRNVLCNLCNIIRK